MECMHTVYSAKFSEYKFFVDLAPRVFHENKSAYYNSAGTCMRRATTLAYTYVLYNIIVHVRTSVRYKCMNDVHMHAGHINSRAYFCGQSQIREHYAL